MTTPSPLVSIGMPVYNGEAYLEAALQTLLAQDYPRLEIVISDNASTDRTEEICQRLVANDPRIRYTRNAENLGAMANFVRVVQYATGTYFMWAAHDDLWTPQFISILAAALDANPEAVLATPRTVYIKHDGTPATYPDDRSAPGTSRLENLRVFYTDDATTWTYGLFRTAWMRPHVEELLSERYPVWGGDVMWLSTILLRYYVVGSPEATIFKRMGHNSAAPKTEYAQIRFVLDMLWRLRAIVGRYCEDDAERAVLMRMVWWYIYRQHFRRRTPFKTLRRTLRLPFAALRFWIEQRRQPKNLSVPKLPPAMEQRRADAA